MVPVLLWGFLVWLWDDTQARRVASEITRFVRAALRIGRRHGEGWLDWQPRSMHAANAVLERVLREPPPVWLERRRTVQVVKAVRECTNGMLGRLLRWRDRNDAREWTGLVHAMGLQSEPGWRRGRLGRPRRRWEDRWRRFETPTLPWWQIARGWNPGEVARVLAPARRPGEPG